MAASTRNARYAVAAVVCALGLAACRTGVPLIDANPGPPGATGTITGTVSGADGEEAIAGRAVTVVNLETGERTSITTSDTGGFTLKVTPGRYRVDVALLAGESVLKAPAPFKVSRSELQHDIDIRVGMKQNTIRYYQPPLPDAAAPIA